MGKSKLTGAWGEALAAEYLRKKRYTVVASGYRCRFGEIDLIVKNKAFLVFVEVKLRKSADFAQAMEYVDGEKAGQNPHYRRAVSVRKPHGLTAPV